VSTESNSLECPKYGGELESKKVTDDIIVDQCNQCYGLFIPAGMTRKLLTNWGPDTMVDTGSDTLGKKFDKIGDIDCPKCKVKMDKMEDHRQPHIWIECCPVCSATFFDAGELTDLKEKTLSDLFKRFMKGKRK
jgi:Zn-finger nucleic acid-binding protein|tara:strand:+ start:550 stop:951 length:402 start_codon:yes stop_codon:yes gene_type:complete